MIFLVLLYSFVPLGLDQLTLSRSHGFFASWSYRPDIDIRFLTEELGFESDTECVQFLCDNGAQDLIEQKSDDKGVPRTIRFQTTKALSLFEDMKRTAFKKVDIKGQL